jgi:hypothetical protein
MQISLTTCKDFSHVYQLVQKFNGTIGRGRNSPMSASTEVKNGTIGRGRNAMPF